MLKYSSIYGIAAIGAAIVIISGGIDLSPGAVIALASVVTGGLMVEAGWSLAPSIAAGLFVGVLSGLLISLLVIAVQLPPFIATLGAMGIVRGAGFILTEGRYFDVSQVLARGWRPLGIPLDWWPPAVMVLLAVVFQLAMHRLQWGRAVYAVGGNETAALFSGISLGRIKTSVYLISATLAAVSGVVLALVQGQGKADLAMGYELDIIASAVVGGASLSGGRGSVIGAVLGALIFGVLRNALAQIPGATFYDRMIVGCRGDCHRRDGSDTGETRGVDDRSAELQFRVRKFESPGRGTEVPRYGCLEPDREKEDERIAAALGLFAA